MYSVKKITIFYKYASDGILRNKKIGIKFKYKFFNYRVLITYNHIDDSFAEYFMILINF